MAFTDNSDLFASFHEDGFNRLLFHVMQQRPSLFNYATATILQNPQFLCEVIESHPVVIKRGNPTITLEQPLPIVGSNFGLDFAAQIREVKIDFHPEDEFPLPSELAPLQPQQLGIKLRFCVGLGCPPDEIVDRYIPPPPDPNSRPDPFTGIAGAAPAADEPLRPLPFRRLLCFCLDVYATGGVAIKSYWGKPWLEPFLTGVEIVDVSPQNLEQSLECYIKLLLKLVILPKLRILLEFLPFNILQLATVTLKPTPESAQVPNNPAIEEDQLKAFINVEIT
jgi:hypothetical protein